jgi:hypothetical protein
MILVFEYIYILSHSDWESERSERVYIRPPFLPTVHSYGGDAPVIFISLNYELREICLGIMVLVF